MPECTVRLLGVTYIYIYIYIFFQILACRHWAITVDGNQSKLLLYLFVDDIYFY